MLSTLPGGGDISIVAASFSVITTAGAAAALPCWTVAVDLLADNAAAAAEITDLSHPSTSEILLLVPIADNDNDGVLSFAWSCWSCCCAPVPASLLALAPATVAAGVVGAVETAGGSGGDD